MLWEKIAGRKIGEYFLYLGEVKKGRFPEESKFTLFLRDRENQISREAVATGRFFLGRELIKPWMEINYREKVKIKENTIELSKTGLNIALFQILSELIPPGGHMMVKYLDHLTTAKALSIGIPPIATPIGYLLWKSGFRWFKDWYFPEGGMEGEPKLQANKPLNSEIERTRINEIAIELKEFLDKKVGGESEVEKISRELALKILKEMGIS
ncbi:MAG: DUF1122 family protein [Methanocellales archaeon]